METDSTRASLLSRVRDPADHAAWREFESRYGELILRYARACGLQLADAEDVRQAVLLGLSRTLRTFQYSPERGRFRHYVGRAARNRVRLVRARHSAAPAPLDSDEHGLGVPDEGSAAPDAVWEREWMAHHYRRALRTVRETFDARSIAMFERLMTGVNAEAVAEEFGASPGGVRQVKHRIRERLRELIVAQVREEDPDGD